MQIGCVITDDEPMARKGLESYVKKVDFLTLTGVCEDAMQLNTLLKKEQDVYKRQLLFRLVIMKLCSLYSFIF